MYTTDMQENGTVSARDEERLPPGGFSLRHGFPKWFGRGSRALSESRRVSGEQVRHPASGQASYTPSNAYSPESEKEDSPNHLSAAKRNSSIYHILQYVRSAFDDDEFLDSVPLEAAGNPGAWHAWRTHRRKLGKLRGDGNAAESKLNCSGDDDARREATAPIAATRRPGEWNWDGVWEDRVRKGITASLSEPVLYGGCGAPDELIRFLAMEDNDVASVKENVLRTLGGAA